LRMMSGVAQPFGSPESHDPQAVRVGSQVSPETRDQLTGSLFTRLECELRTADNRMEPSGAVDYYATFFVDWFPSEIDTEPDEVVLAAAARAAGIADATSECIEIPVGRAHFLIVDSADPNLYEALDAKEGDLELLGSALLSQGHLVDALADQLEPGSGYGILGNSLCIDAPWRGMHLGLRGAALALNELRRGCDFAAVFPMEPGTMTEDERQASHARLAKYWARLGFEHWQNQIMVLDLNLTTFDQSVAAAGIGLV
jgi:hypothetical protein